MPMFKIAISLLLAACAFGAFAAPAQDAALTNAAPAKTAASASAVPTAAGWRISTRVFHLSHANAAEVAAKFNETWEGVFDSTRRVAKMAVAFPESNSVMVTAPGAILEACAAAIVELDVEPRQVYIEARFVELSNQAFRNLGIDWSMLNGMKGTASFGAGIEGHHLGSGVNEYHNYSTPLATVPYASSGYSLAKGDGDVTFFNGTLDFSQLYLVLYALQGNEDARVFSNPKIIVSSGKKAIVDMTTKYPNVSIAAKKTINNNNESVDLDMKMSEIPGEDKFMFAREAFFSWGISLEVVPRIGTNGLINVSIVPTISDCGGFVSAGTDAGGDSAGAAEYSSKYPIIEVQRLITEFSMASGSTAVIGGLSCTKEEQVDDGIPWLSSIPWIGDKLFGGKRRQKVQKEIIVFVTVGLVDPANMAKDAGLPKNAILGRQYTRGVKLEPGDRPESKVEGLGTLDLRSLEEQAKASLAKEQESSNSNHERKVNENE